MSAPRAQPRPRVRVLLDSGAFSSWKKGEPIELDKYIEFIKEYQDLIANYVCLDTIPGKLGRMDRSQDAIEESAEASYRNQQKMRDAGLAPIPVFHQGERWHWLERYVADGEPYVGISPYLRSTQANLMAWLDECFTRVTDSAGRAIVKTHGFGVTAHEAVWRYPWQSVDSTTWAIAPCYGMLVMPCCDLAGNFDLRRPARQFYVGGGIKLGTEKAPTFVSGSGGMFDWAAGRNLDALDDVLSGGETLDWVHKYAEQCGTSVTAFRHDQYARTAAHIVYFKMLGDQRGEVLFKPSHRRGSFLAEPASARRAGKPADVRFRVIFATNTCYKQGRILTQFGVMDRLLSYWVLRDCKTLRPRLEEYVTRGFQGKDRGLNVSQAMIAEPVIQRGWDSRSYIDFRRRCMSLRAGEGGDGEEAVS